MVQKCKTPREIIDMGDEQIYLHTEEIKYGILERLQAKRERKWERGKRAKGRSEE